jgi:hypothetical protein
MCETCDYKCSKLGDYKKHILTQKHIKANDANNNANTKSPEDKKIMCNVCGITLKHLSSLSRHKKKCISIENNEPDIDKISTIEFNNNNIKVLTNLVLEVVKSNSELLKQNQEYQKQNNDLQKQVLDVCQKIQPNTINSNNHSNNKTFNLQFFLNEQCKDAMNIMDFVDTFQLKFDDLERIGEVGYVEGISNLIIDKLNGMDIYKRPIHCSDAKREIMHIKDNGVWEKDNENNDKLRLAIKHITKKNIDMIGSWTEKYPGVRYSDHRLNDKFNEIIMEAMGGKNNKTMKEGEGKIIKKISKMVLINKNM